MIVTYETELYKNTLLMQTYAKAQKKINEYSHSPQSTKAPTYHDVEITGELGFIEFVPVLQARLYMSTNRDCTDTESYEIMNSIFRGVEEQMHLAGGHFYQFTLLLDNQHLLTVNEMVNFTERYHKMFSELSSVGCVSFPEFYDMYYLNHFYNTKRLDVSMNQGRLEYAYILFADIGMHDNDTYGPGFMGRFMDFARSYAELYDDLENIIAKREVRGSDRNHANSKEKSWSSNCSQEAS